MRPLSEAETAQLRHICPSFLSPDRLVRYAEDLRITCPGGTLEPGDLNNHDVVGASMDALMEAGDLQHHMLKDKVNCCSKRSFIVGMTGTTDDQTLARVCGAWMKSHPTFKKWLEAGQAKLTSCRSSQHDRGIMCTRCDAFSALRARQLGDNVVAVHQAGPRLWGEDDYKAVIGATRGAPHSTTTLRKIMQSPPYDWLSCKAATRTGDYPPDEVCSWCPSWRKHLCVCGAQVATVVPPSVVIAGDLATISGAPTIFCGTLCVRNTYVPTTRFPELRRWLQDRDGRGRRVRAVDIFGSISGSDPPLVDRLLCAHGQHGAPPAFPAHWVPVQVTIDSFGRDNAERIAARARALFMRQADPAGSTSPLDSVLPAFGNCRKQAEVNRQFNNALHGGIDVGDAVKNASMAAWGNSRFLARNKTLRWYPSARQAVIPVIHTRSARARQPRGDDDNVEDEATAVAAAGEGGASASSTVSVVESFYDPTVFTSKGAFDEWLATGEDVWVYTTTRREEMLCVLKHGIHAIFTILSAAAGKPGGSAGFHLRPLTSWSVLMYAATFGFHKMDVWGGEGNVYLLLMKETADSALQRAAVYMKTGYTFGNCSDAERRAAALSVPHEWAAGR